MTLVAALSGIAAAVGILLIVTGLRAVPVTVKAAAPTHARRLGMLARISPQARLRALVALAVGLILASLALEVFTLMWSPLVYLWAVSNSTSGAEPRWFVTDTRKPGDAPSSLAKARNDWGGSYRIEYAPPPKADVTGLPNAGLIRHGRLLTRAFSVTGAMD